METATAMEETSTGTNRLLEFGVDDMISLISGHRQVESVHLEVVKLIFIFAHIKVAQSPLPFDASKSSVFPDRAELATPWIKIRLTMSDFLGGTFAGRFLRESTQRKELARFIGRDDVRVERLLLGSDCERLPFPLGGLEPFALVGTRCAWGGKCLVGIVRVIKPTKKTLLPEKWAFSASLHVAIADLNAGNPVFGVVTDLEAFWGFQWIGSENSLYYSSPVTRVAAYTLMNQFLDGCLGWERHSPLQNKKLLKHMP
ncbi:hypothetical protein Poli38472_009407 [Pythium oligandrum]|uniref:Uncharacterized protein n=1 Tax=Pythium oligandrum TaxID=41045 RepID=A0A8K1CMB0_PYTOL|nr:hypothetical protein Poli38472_009407 [Pythium oligandrum]|eukprot:TMW65240.1 hypothetical protein Poli38472_009407 [Pythium oligandrum]